MELHLILTITLSKRGCGPLLLMREQAQGGEDIHLGHGGRKHKEVVKYVCSGVRQAPIRVSASFHTNTVALSE